MLKVKAAAAGILSVLLMLPLTACDFVDALLGKDITQTVETSADFEGRYDIASVEADINSLKEIWSKTGEEEAVQELIDRLLLAVDESAAIHSRAQMEYYANWTDETLAAKEKQSDLDYCEIYDMVLWAFSNGYSKSRSYAELFKPYIAEEYLNYYLSYSLSRIRSASRSTTKSYGEILDSYYDTAYDDTVDIDETNKTCAKLYLDTLDTYDTSEYLYDYYKRDYTVEQASEMYGNIVDKLVPLYMEVYGELYNDPRYEQYRESDPAVTDPFQTLQTYAQTLSPEIAESVNKLINESLYCTASGENCYDGCYTVALPSEQSALMYIYEAGNCFDLTSVVHEFGHFHSDWRDTTPTLIQSNIIDVAEVQSQGMEMLFTQFYKDIYGEDAVFMEQLALFNMMDSVVSGFAVGEFEYEVMKNQDRFSAQDVIDTFDRIYDECMLGTDLYQITHLYEQPGYFVSYGASALAALQLYAEMQQDYSAALARYTKIAEISSARGDKALCAALQDAGFADIFDPEEFDALIDVLQERVEELK